MKVRVKVIEGIAQRCLIVNANDKTTPCEECGKPMYSHPDLAKEDPDWCINCNDKKFRPGFTDEMLGMWSLQQIELGKIICVVTEMA